MGVKNPPEGGDGAADKVQWVPEEGQREHRVQAFVGVAVIEAKALQRERTSKVMM